LEKLESEARERAIATNNPEDSLAIMTSFYDEHGGALERAKRARLKLGLDLRGGMYVTLEVDIVKLIQESAESESIDDLFMQVLDKTAVDQKASDAEVIDIFLRNFDQIARPKGKTLLNYFGTTDFRNVSEEAIISKLHENADQAIDQAREVIRQRIDQYGVSEPNINKSGTRRIVLELPGVQNRDEMMSLLQTTARLEFHLVRNNQDIVRAFSRIDKYLVEQNRRKAGTVDVSTENLVTESVVETSSVSDEVVNQDATDTNIVATNDTTGVSDTTPQATDPNDPYAGLSDEEAQKKYLAEHPFTSIFTTFYLQGTGDRQQLVNFGYLTDDIPDGEYRFRIAKDSLTKFFILLNRPDIRTFLPLDLIICVDAKPDLRLAKQQNFEVFDFYSLKKEPELTGDVITDARATFDPVNNQPVVSMSMNSEGADN
jgi:preprotein translocase subunit SecD